MLAYTCEKILESFGNVSELMEEDLSGQDGNGQVGRRVYLGKILPELVGAILMSRIVQTKIL